MRTDVAADGPDKGPGWRYYLQSRVVVIFFLGFSAGLPFLLVYSTLTAWLQESGLATSKISMFAWLGFAYSFKFVWSPIVDAASIPLLTRWLGRRRAWLFVTQLGLALALFSLAQLDPAASLPVFAAVAGGVAFLSATQDIVLDAYRVESAETEMQGMLAAAYQYGYRVAVVVSGAGALYIAEFGSWRLSYTVMGACMGVGFVTTLLCKEPEVNASPAYHFNGSWYEITGKWFLAAVVGPFTDFFRRYGKFALTLLVFLSVFRISDYVLGILANPFYLVIGFTKTEIANVAKVYGLWVSFVGIALGGWSVLKFGLLRSVVLATVLIASTNLFFAWMAVTGAKLWMLAVTISADNIASGFSGTVFIAYLSSLTNISFTATQYALFSSMSTFIGKLTAGYSGQVQEWIGWFGFFLYAAALGIPAIILSLIVARGTPAERKID